MEVHVTREIECFFFIDGIHMCMFNNWDCSSRILEAGFKKMSKRRHVSASFEKINPLDTPLSKLHQCYRKTIALRC